MIATNPAAQMSTIKVKNDSDAVRAFEPKEYDRVIAAIPRTTMTDVNKARIKALMQLQRWSGLSLVDAVCLSKEELKQTGDSFSVACDRQKTGTHINNWIPTWLGEELLKVKNGNPEYFFWTGMTTPEDAPSYFQKLYRKVFAASGVTGSSHDFRHTYAKELLVSGVDIRMVQKALGHSSLQVTERYYSKWDRAQQGVLHETLRNAMAQK
jgi:integrase/recombinase XerD